MLQEQLKYAENDSFNSFQLLKKKKERKKGKKKEKGSLIDDSMDWVMEIHTFPLQQSK